MCPHLREIDLARVRLDELQENVRELSAPAGRPLPRAFDHLRRALDELRRTDAELQQQNAALRTARVELEAERQRFKKLFEFAPGGYLVTTPHGRVQEWNPVVERMLGMRREALMGIPLSSLVSEAQRSAFERQLGRLKHAAAGSLEHWDVTLRRDGGDPFPAAVSVCPAHGAGGRLVELRWLVQDISETHHLERALATEEERRAAIVRSIPNGLLSTGPRGDIVLLNEAAAAVLGTTRERALGRPLAEVAPAIAAVSAGGAEGAATQDAVLVGASRRTVRVTTTRITEGPEDGGRVLLLDDVTAEREAKERLEEQDRLAAMGQLAAGIAHDFNNILSVVVGSADLLRADRAVPESARAKLATVAEHGRRGSRLIRQILDFSRRSVTEPQPVDLVPFLSDIASLLERTLPENVALHVEVGDGEYRVYVDPTQLQHLIANLALNARDAMPHGGHLALGLARLHLAPGDPAPVAGMRPGGWIAISVGDTGIGIPADVQGHVFEPFFTTKGPGKGTGLGLAQVYGIVAQHGGFIELASAPGWGTRFTVHLPAFAAELPAVPRAVADPFPTGHRETILLVEDDPGTCEVTDEALRFLDYQVLVADSAEKALELWTQHRQTIAMVLTDLVMPGMGGAELYRALRRRSATVPVVVMSGYPLGVERGDPSLQGISNWLQKPADIDELAQAVHRALVDR